MLDPGGSDNSSKFQEFYLGLSALRSMMEGPFVPIGYEDKTMELKELLHDVAREFDNLL